MRRRSKLGFKKMNSSPNEHAVFVMKVRIARRRLDWEKEINGGNIMSDQVCVFFF